MSTHGTLAAYMEDARELLGEGQNTRVDSSIQRIANVVNFSSSEHANIANLAKSKPPSPLSRGEALECLMLIIDAVRVKYDLKTSGRSLPARQPDVTRRGVRLQVESQRATFPRGESVSYDVDHVTGTR
jgi:hypothetical protein